MGRRYASVWLSRLGRRRGLLLVLLLVLAGAALSAPWLGAWYHLRQGRLELQRYHAEKARRHLAAYLRWWPRDVTANLLASRAARQLGEFDEAEQHLRQAQQEQSVPSEEVILEWALHHATLGDLDRTEAYLLPLAREDSERSPLACEALAEGGRRTYRIPHVLGILDLWLKRQPDNVRAYLLRGHLYGQIHLYSKAVPNYRRVLELDPEQEEARRWLAVCLVEGLNWHEALPHLEVLQKQHPDNREVQVLMARCRSSLGERRQAEQILQAVAAEQPDNMMVLRSLGESLLQDNRPAEAEPWLRRAIALAPHDYKGNWFLYQALEKQNKIDAAERQLKRTEEVERLWNRFHTLTQREIPVRPHDVALQAELGALLLDMGFTDSSRNWLLNVLHRDPQCRPAHEALARYYQQQGDDEKAAQHRRQARAATDSTTSAVPPLGP
jgi:predicted Zn-dependent protease